MQRIFLLALVLAITFRSSNAGEYSPQTAALDVATMLADWKDSKRDRVVPVKVYFPETRSKPLPVIIFSHGLGGTREAYEYLGRAWAGNGFVSVHLQHAGSDDSVWRD